MPTEDSDSGSSPGVLTPAGSSDSENSLEMLKSAYTNFSNEVDTLRSDLIYYKLQASRHRVKYLDLKEKHKTMVASWEADKEKTQELERGVLAIERTWEADKVKTQELERQIVLIERKMRRRQADGELKVMELKLGHRAQVLEGELKAMEAKLRKIIMAFAIIFGVMLALLMNRHLR
jgi:chromosome segregation ATPase